MRVVVLVDGEHYPPVVRAAIGGMRARGDDVVAAVFLGGSEKLTAGDLDSAYGIAVQRDEDRELALVRALDEHRPDVVVDLSDEPVVSADDRFRMAAHVLARGAVYRGPDFELRPPEFVPVLTKPSIRVIATGKRTGKTAVAGALGRRAVERGYSPVIVAMGRGGPPEPVVIEAGAAPDTTALLALTDAGLHAASDYIEDAITSRVTTIGCRRVGGGLAGGVYESNVVRGAHLAEDRPEDMVILEGSGAAIPPVVSRAGLLCVSATTPPADITDYLGPYRLLLADVVVVTMAEERAPAAELETTIRRISPSISVVRSVFRPKPLADVGGKRVFYATTAPLWAQPMLTRHLEGAYGCEVVAMSHTLADRERLAQDLADAPVYDVLVTEVKAAAIDVAVRLALAGSKEVVFADNELVGEGVEDALDRLLTLAATRA
jgi:cyclic 2,3-diphosphoglycerate synthetase